MCAFSYLSLLLPNGETCILKRTVDDIPFFITMTKPIIFAWCIDQRISLKHGSCVFFCWIEL